MNKELLKDILSVPSFSRKEELVAAYLQEWAVDNGVETKKDAHGNIFIKKGVLAEGESYPCVVAHMDTVHRDQVTDVDENERLHISEGNGVYGDILYAQKMDPSGMLYNTGCGGDDKAGIFICLELIEKFDTIMGFFPVEEEIGCNGSRAAKNDEWLEQCGWFMQFDAPTGDWISRKCSGVELFNNDFAEILQPVWDEYGLSKPSERDPFTDVKELKTNYPVCCINYFAGYMEMHTTWEFVVIDYVEKAIEVGTSTINELGKNEYLY
jgi:tripeptide aminopeptidase